MSSAHHDNPNVERLWQAARYLPRTVRLLGTRYRSLFLAHAQRCRCEGERAAIADALAFVDFMRVQNRLGLLPPERDALGVDERRLRRRFRLKREGDKITAIERWKILQWLSL